MAERLAGEPLTGLFVSPFSRTTGRPSRSPPRAAWSRSFVGDLREVHTGELEGGEFRIRVARGDPLIAAAVRGGALGRDPRRRADEAFERASRAAVAAVVAAAGPGAALVVTHGAFIAEVCRQATASRPFAFLNVDNASITRIVLLPAAARSCATSTTSRTSRE